MTRKYITTYNSCKSLNKQTSVTDLLLTFRKNYFMWLLAKYTITVCMLYSIVIVIFCFKTPMDTPQR